MNFMPWFQSNWDIVDLNWNVITSSDRNKILTTVWQLPVNWYKDVICDAVRESVITVISAETWSWKTTQVPKMLMWWFDLRPNQVVVAEPRVIATIWAANRVSREKLSETWDVSFSLWQKIWYRTWREVNSAKHSELLFVTDWLQLLRQYVTNVIPDILIVDEVHTYSVSTEFLLSQLRNTLIETNKKIKLVLMSATMDIDRIKHFFKDITTEIPVFDIPWRTFPVEKEFKEEIDFFPSIIKFAKENRNILVFVEWKKEIEQTIENLKKQLPNYDILPLHSELPITEQNSVLSKWDSPRIIVATNVAQESITIDYINAVVDNWYCKVLRVNDRWVPELHREVVSKADANQRAWRAWRVMDWYYVRANDTSFEDLHDYPEWEIENITLEKFILIALSIWFNPLKYLKSWKNIFVHKPNLNLVKMSYNNLVSIWAITKDNQVTKLGRELLNFPLEPHVWRMLKESLKRWCSWDMIDICAIINHKWFLSKIDVWKQFVRWAYKEHSDLIAQRNFFLFLTRRDPLDKETINKLKWFWIDKYSIRLFQEYANNGKEKMLFEVVDFTELWVKSKRLYEILYTINILKERLSDDPDFRLEYAEENKEEIKEAFRSKWEKYNIKTWFENICKCILSWMLGDQYVYNRQTKMFYNELKWWFIQPMTSTITPSEKSIYIGQPFVIWWIDWKEDLRLLSFITKVDEMMLDEIWHPIMQEVYSDVRFWYNEWKETRKQWRKLEPYIVANIQKDIWWVSLSNVIAQVPKEKLKSVLAFAWLPDFLIENNMAVIKYIKSRKDKSVKSKFNIDRFREILKLFTPNIIDRFYMENLPKTLDWYKHDSSVMENFFNSNIPWIVEFRNDPYKDVYTKQLTIQSLKPTSLDPNVSNDIKTPWVALSSWVIHIIDHLHKTSKYSRNKVREFIEYWALLVDWKKATTSTYIDPEKSVIEIDFAQVEIAKIILRLEREKQDRLSADEIEKIRFDVESKYIKWASKKQKRSVQNQKTDIWTKASDKVTSSKKPTAKAKPKETIQKESVPALPKSSTRHTWDKVSRKKKKELEDLQIKDISVFAYLSKNWILPRKTAEKYLRCKAILLDWNPLWSCDKLPENLDTARITFNLDALKWN